MPRRPSPLKAAAANAGLSLTEVAARSGYSPNTVGNVSRGTIQPWPEFCRRMVEVFGFDPFNTDVAA